MLIHSSSRTKTKETKKLGIEMGHKTSDEVKVFLRLIVRISFTQIYAQILQSRLQSLFCEDNHCPKGQNLTDINQKQTSKIKLNNRWLANCALQKLTRQHTYLQILNHKQMFRLSDIQAKLLTGNTMIKTKKHEKWGTKGKKQK